MTYIFIACRCDDLPVAVCCRVMKVSTSGFYAWQAQPVSDRDLDDAMLTNHIFDIHACRAARMGRRGCMPSCARGTSACAVAANGWSG